MPVASKWNEILSTQVSLMPESGKELPADVLTELQAAIAGTKSTGDEAVNERLCSLVLFHRLLAQVMVTYGYEAPESLVLAPGQTEFKSIKIPGYFETADRNFADDLLTLEALVTVFNATSPTVDSKNFDRAGLFGDIKDLTNKTAIIPDKIHDMTLDLISQRFKAMLAENIILTDAKGLPFKPKKKDGQKVGQKEDKPSGVLLIETQKDNGLKVLKLSNLLAMIRLSVHLERGLNELQKGVPAAKWTDGFDRWSKISAVYKIPVLTALLGVDVGTQDELKDFPAAALEEAKSKALQPSLKKMMLPLALLVLKMTEIHKDKTQCVSEMSWNEKTGELSPLASCDPEQITEAHSALDELAIATHSPALYQRK